MGRGAVLILIAATAALLFTRARPPMGHSPASVAVPAVQARATFVAETSCAGCHAEQAAAWHGSHHDLAMQEPMAATVLGDFNNASFTKNGVRTRFFRRAGK